MLEAVSTSCRWVPGTTDRVLVQHGPRSVEWTIAQVRLLLGVHAVHDLYLRGRFEGRASREAVRAMSAAA